MALIMRPAHHKPHRRYGVGVEGIRTPRGIRVDPSALRYEFTRSGGPGGQHVNTSATRATVVLDVDAGLSARAAARVRAQHGPQLRATSSVHRSQWRNRRAALDRLLRRIDEAMEEPERRRATRVPNRERSRRREAKARRARRLDERRIPPE
jgi:ribosome-associated protein